MSKYIFANGQYICFKEMKLYTKRNRFSNVKRTESNRWAVKRERDNWGLWVPEFSVKIEKAYQEWVDSELEKELLNG